MLYFLVTGGAGNIGSSLVRKLIENDKYFVVIVDNLVTGSLDKLPATSSSNWVFKVVNVNCNDDLIRAVGEYQFDYIFHFAALVGVQRTLSNPLAVLEDISGIRNLLELGRKQDKLCRYFYSSSSEVYGEPVSLPQIENVTPLNSVLPYAVVKNVGEVFVKSYFSEYKMPYTILRFFNTYGPQQSSDFVVPKFMNLALRNKDITIYGDGTQTRTFCFIDDNIDTIINMVGSDFGLNDIINVGSDIEFTIKDLASLCLKVCNSSSKIIFLPALLHGDMTRRCPDITKMRLVLNRELLPLESGLQILRNYYKTL